MKIKTIIALFYSFAALANTKPQFVVIIPSYNNAQWYQKNLDSVFMQDYDQYRIIYIDDCSPDETGNLVEEYINQFDFESSVTLIKNTVRKGALANLYYAIHSCDNNEIAVTLDGDDWFTHETVLSKLAEVYSDKNTWLTYGQYTHPWGGTGCCRPIEKEIIENNAYRTRPNVASHLRTFYTWLFKQIKLEDLLYQGTFYPMTWDWAMMYPMLEMSGGKFTFISDILYLYNTGNPINDFKVDYSFQEHLGKVIQQKRTYQPVDKDKVLTEKVKEDNFHIIIVTPEQTTYHDVIDQSMRNVTFVACTADINTTISKIIRTKEQSIDYCAITNSNDFNTVSKQISKDIALLEQTQAFACSIVDVEKNTLSEGQKYAHYSHLDNQKNHIFTYQLGWKPELSIAHEYGHIINLSYLKSLSNEDSVFNNSSLSEELKEKFPEWACLLVTP